MKLPSRLSLALAGLAVAAGVLVAYTSKAGYRANNPVVVYNPGNNTGYFYGMLGAARNSSDGTQYLGCWNDTWQCPATVPGATCISAGCLAVDASGLRLYCSIPPGQNDMVQTVRSLPADGYLSVITAYGQCSEINVSNYSYNPPKNP